MKLVFTGRAGAGLCDWESFALLRDNVQHFVEGGLQSGRFSALHGIARAVDGDACIVDAVRLRLEVLQAWSALWSVRVDGAAVSSRTRAIREHRVVPAGGSVTGPAIANVDLLQFAGNWSAPVPKAAGSFVTAVLSLTNTAVAGDLLEVRRMPSARQPASRSGAAG
jgi:hypothetical protein